jgi:enoyl-CoA hydratase/carnithine racemase
MNQKSVVYEKKESVGIVVLDRPNFKNAIDDQMVSELTDIRDEINWDNDVKVVILTGAGQEAFSVGTDKKEYLPNEDKLMRIKRLSLASIVGALNCPTIAAINGDAFGQGFELALACDLRICSRSSRFAMTQVTDGEIPWDGGTQRLSRLVGKGKALELTLTGETIDAQEAFRIGLIIRVVSSDQLMAVAMDVAKEMASKSTIALRYTKEAIHKGMDLTLEQGLRLEADLYFLTHTTRDRKEGILAFREKRTPKFEGK